MYFLSLRHFFFFFYHGMFTLVNLWRYLLLSITTAGISSFYSKGYIFTLEINDRQNKLSYFPLKIFFSPFKHLFRVMSLETQLAVQIWRFILIKWRTIWENACNIANLLFNTTIYVFPISNIQLSSPHLTLLMILLNF